MTIYTKEDFENGKFDQTDLDLISDMCTRDILIKPISIPKKYRLQVDGDVKKEN